VTCTVRIPSQLRSLTDGLGEVPIEAGTVGEALDVLSTTYPGMHERLFDEEGGLRRFLNVFVADEDVRFLQGLATGLHDGQTISILPAIAGG
jgi:sulfur-carrier protein